MTRNSRVTKIGEQHRKPTKALREKTARDDTSSSLRRVICQIALYPHPTPSASTRFGRRLAALSIGVSTDMLALAVAGGAVIVAVLEEVWTELVQVAQEALREAVDVAPQSGATHAATE